MVEGPDAGVRARVSRRNDGSLAFELTYPENTKSTAKSGKYKHRAIFRADLLGSGPVNVLQLRMYTYAEFDRDGERFWDSSQGFLFQRVALTTDAGFEVHRLNLDALGKVAEENYAGSDFKIDLESFTECFSEDVVTSLWLDIWDSLEEESRIKLVEVLETDQEELSGFQQEIARLAELEVDPYAELAHIRNCVTALLPTESLEQIFLQHTDRVFSGGTDQYVRD